MQTIVEKLPNGNEITYKIVNGTAYHIETPDEVVKWLETSRQYNKRIRIFYGDKDTGRDWLEEYETIGTIGRSNGRVCIPLLIKTSRSFGGAAILDSNIVRITIDGRDVYKHPNYHQGEFTIVQNPYPNDTAYIEAVCVDGDSHAAFMKSGQAEKWIKFMKGERNSK